MSRDTAALAAGSRISYWFAKGAAGEPGAGSSTAASSSSSSILANIWASRILLALQTLLLPLAFWFKPLCLFVALAWLAYRASQILRKPLDELSTLLGFDLPASPLVDLADVRADGAIVHWSIPGKPKNKSQLKVDIHLNGTIIEQLSWHESAVTLMGLQPGAFYVVRVALTQNEITSKSTPIRFRTKPAASDDFFNIIDAADTDHDGVQERLPRVRPYRGLTDVSPASPTSTAMGREHSSGWGQAKNYSRRPSPATIAIDHRQDPQPDEMDLRDGPETMQELTAKLDSIRRETEEAEKMAREEEEDDLRQKEDLMRERDALRAEVNDKEKTSRNLKREVNTLERQNTTAQNERAKQERLLLQKKQERRKLKDDVVRWERELHEFNADVERIGLNKADYADKAQLEKSSLRDKLAEETAKAKGLDDAVKEKNAEIKRLDRVMKDSSPNGADGAPNLVQQLQNDAEEERRWQSTRLALQQQYSSLYKQVENAKKYHAEQLRYLEFLRVERRRQDEIAQHASSVHDRRPQRADSQRSRNAQSRHSVSESPRMGNFPVNHSPFSSNINPVPSGFNASPFFNIHNGMTIPGPTDEVTMSEEERERLTGGAMISPNAGAGLIPTDLFSGEGEHRVEHVQPLPGLGSLPGLPGLPGPSQMHHDSSGAGPASPAASSSRSPSVFASPQASQQNLHSISSPDNAMDADRRSIRSTRSNRAPSGGASSRFSVMFGIKQRNKNVSEDGPPLSKANSMPRQDQGVSGLDSATRKRNSSMSGGVLGPLDNGLDGSSDSPTTASGRRAFGFLSRDKSGGWPSSFTAFNRRPVSPRPGSTHSNELPKPSMESSRWGADAWSLTDAGGGARGSPLAFGPGWNAPSQTSRLYGSRHPSRRPSVQYGASGPPEDIMEDDDSDALEPNQSPNLAPIGTKPSKKADPKLNPNAKDFKSFLSSMRFGSKDKGKDSGESSDRNESGTPLALSTTTSSHFAGGAEVEESPPTSRKSRDTRSMTTEESSVVGSGRNSPDLFRTPSHTNSDVPAPSPSLTGRESFMQKISRKSSSSKFSLPSFKRDKTARQMDASTSSASTPVPAEDDEDPMGASMSESVGSLRDPNGGASLRAMAMEKDARDSREGNRSSRSWSSAFKLGGKKKGTETQSLSDRISMTSGTGTEDGDDEEEV